MTIKIKKKDNKNWTSIDFLLLYKSKYEEKYHEQLEVNYVKDCSIMKRVISIFKKHDKPKGSVIKFINWVFDEYYSNKKFTTPIKIGFLQYCIEDYLGTSLTDVKKPKNKPVVLSNEMKEWLEEQKKVYVK